MLYGLFADIHGNYDALEVVSAFLRQQKVDQAICLGDIVGYGAQPNECVKEVRSLKSVAIAGNHDWAVLGKENTDYFNPFARDAISWTNETLSQGNLDYLATLPLTNTLTSITLVHSSLEQPGEFPYLETITDAEACFSLLDSKILFIAHTHIPVNFIKKDDEIYWNHLPHITIDDNASYIINIGSVGQPRDGDPRACVALYDSDANEVRLQRLEYNIELAAQKIYDAGLPKILADRLFVGR